jgi:cytoskeletal protein RodZ
MSQILGKQLREIRQSRGLSLEEISQITHIQVDYLEAIEIGEQDSLPSKTHLRGFLRLYANALGVTIEDLEKEVATTLPSPEAEAIESDSLKMAPASPKEETIEEKQKEVLPRETDSKKTFIASSEVPDVQLEQKTVTRESTQIPEQFVAIGKKMRERRELLSLSLEDIENHLHIRINYLKAIESGTFEQLPSPVQAKGMIVNYATFLNLDSEQVLMQYAE